VKNLLVHPRNKAAKPVEASLYIYGAIGPYDDWGDISETAVQKALADIGSASVLNIYVNSPGGSVFTGIAIYQQLRRFKARKIVHVDGLAASIASVIAMGGDEIRMSRASQMMIHNPTWGAYGWVDELEKAIKVLKQSKETLLDTYVARSKQDRGTISAWMDDETWFRADEAIKNGFADVKVDGDEEIELDDNSRVLLAKFKHTPKEFASSQESVARSMVARMKMRSMMMKVGGQSA